MDQPADTYEALLYKFAFSIKRFNNALVEKHKLTDIPYNVSGKAFPKIGSIEIGNQVVNYRFHGSGCTFWQNEKEIYFGVDPTSSTPIVITWGAWSNYLQDSTELVERSIKYLESKGALIPFRQLHYLNEDWFSKQAVLNSVRTSE